MKADEIRLLFGYHFAANLALWEGPVPAISEAQFIQVIPYSHESIRNQTVHLMSVDEGWIGGLVSPERIPFREPAQYVTKASVRAAWDAIETQMQVILRTLTDAHMDQPYNAAVATPTWQILLHVINHGTDHRAQIYAMLNTVGAPSQPQDLAHYLWGRLASSVIR